MKRPRGCCILQWQTRYRNEYNKKRTGVEMKYAIVLGRENSGWFGEVRQGVLTDRALLLHEPVARTKIYSEEHAWLSRSCALKEASDIIQALNAEGPPRGCQPN